MALVYRDNLIRSLNVFCRLAKRNQHSVSLGAGSEEPIKLETGRRGAFLELCLGSIARFAAGSVVASQGDNAVLATCVFKKSGSNQGFTPLTVDYRQSAAAVGKIPTNYLRRELSQSDGDIIASRIIDRTIRPLFPKGWANETQIICKPLSLDEQGDGIVLAVNAAGAALHLSPIPFLGPVAAVRIALVDNQIIINPSRNARRESSIDMILAGCGSNKTVMIEMDGTEIPLFRIEEIFDRGFAAINEMLVSIDELKSSFGKKKQNLEDDVIDEDEINEIQKLTEGRLEYILTDSSLDKIARDEQIRELGNDICEKLKADGAEFWPIFYSIVKSALRKQILDTNKRCDGRNLADFRPITIKIDLYKKLHGSALFQRGQTQVFSTVTFDSPSAAFQPDSISQMLGTQQKKMFMHHYEFPGFATNEITAVRSSNRREIGHGALAEKGLKHVIPKDFPYSIRLASQSNGSSSMASICGGSLALLDAGVPLKAPVAGLAMGLVTNEQNPDEKYKILTDLLGIEDYMGDMDFKVAGTRHGFTTMQLDVKIGGLTRKQLTEALLGAEQGIHFVLDKMAIMRDSPRPEFKSSVPIIENMALDPFKRQILFKRGGYYAKQIEVETGVKISIEDDKHIGLFASNKSNLEEAKQIISKTIASNDERAIEALPYGKFIHNVQVVEMVQKGLYVTIPGYDVPIFIPNKWLHKGYIQDSSVTGLKVGDKITVQYFGRDPNTGQIRMSRQYTTNTSSSQNNAQSNK